MLDSYKQGTQFLVVNDKDEMFALLKGSNSSKALSEAAMKQVRRKYASYSTFSSKVKGVGSKSALLVVRKGPVRWVGAVYNEGGFGPGDADLAVASRMGGHRPPFKIFERFWNDGLFWRKYVQYAFKKQVFGGPALEKIEEEQARTDIQTNREGWVYGKTWASQDVEKERQFLTGMHRGEGLADVEDIRTIRWVNF
jgi:hypothetical protein